MRLSGPLALHNNTLSEDSREACQEATRLRSRVMAGTYESILVMKENDDFSQYLGRE